MADNTKLQYIVELLTQGDAKKATDELNKLNKAGDATAKGMDKTAASARQLFAFLGGTAFITQSIEKFLENERAVNALNSALELTKQIAPGVSEEIQALASALGDDLKKEADDVLKVMTQLLTFGARPENLKRLTEAVFDLSEVMGRDVSRAARQMSQALKGNFEVFQQLGIEVDKTKTATEQFNEGFEKVESMAKGRAKDALKGLGGEVEQLKLHFEQLKETLGGVAGAILTATAGLGQNIGQLLGRSQQEEAVKRMKDQFLALADAISKAVDEAHQLGRISFEEKGRLKTRIGGARELLHGIELGQTTSDAEVQNMLEAILPQAGGLLTSVQRRANLPGSRTTTQPTASPSQIATPGLSEADINQMFDELDKWDQAVVDSINKEHDLRQRLAETQDRQSLEALENFRQEEQIKHEMIVQTHLTSLDGAAKERAQLEANHQKRVEQIQEVKFETEEQYAAAMTAEAELYEAEQKRFEKENSAGETLEQSLAKIGEHAKELAASGLVDALYEIGEGSKSAGEAFREFAASFAKEISKMILKAYALYAINLLIRGITGGGGGSAGTAAEGGSFPALAARGGSFAAMEEFHTNAIMMASGGVAGVSELNRATYFPKFNVIAGEAGREIMTVLAKPRFERINGVPAQIGYAGRNRLAITSADALAGAGGMSGRAVVTVELAPGLIASIKEDSIQGARVQTRPGRRHGHAAKPGDPEQECLIARRRAEDFLGGCNGLASGWFCALIFTRRVRITPSESTQKTR